MVQGRFQGQADSPLSPEGRRQAQLVARRLAHPLAAPVLPIPIGAPLELVQSPLKRTTETAEAIESAAPWPVIRRPDAGFLEIAQGEWEGLHRDDIKARHGETLAAWRRTPTLAWAPGGESLAEVQARVRTGLGRLLGSRGCRLAGTRDRDQVAGYGTPEAATHPWSPSSPTTACSGDLADAVRLALERFWMWSMSCARSPSSSSAAAAVLRATT
ncbi:MAG: histidine phosphatase family protein [Candidatus Limnocylindrales bacterium]